MNINNILNKTFDFIIKRTAELAGILFVFISIFLIISLISYSPDDPNFIFPKDTEIKNIFGFKGSFISDIFYQSIGMASYFVAITIFFTGFNLFRQKKFIIILENLFYTVIYCFLTSLFFSTYYDNSFWLTINGNGGFVGNFLSGSMISNLIKLNNEIFYYILILLSFLFFLISINFNIKNFIKFFINIKNKFFNVSVNKIDEDLSKFEKNYEES